MSLLIKNMKNCKISQCGLPDLHLIPYGIKMNLEISMVRQKYKSLIAVKFRQNTLWILLVCYINTNKMTPRYINTNKMTPRIIVNKKN
jgi:ATP sulfurylase